MSTTTIGAIKRIEITNLAGDVVFNRDLDLELIKQRLGDRVREVKNFNAMQLLLLPPKMKALIYPKNYAVIVGANDSTTMAHLIGMLVRELKRTGMDIEPVKVNINNAVGTVWLDLNGNCIDLEKLTLSLPGNVIYEPDSFPAATVKFKKKNNKKNNQNNEKEGNKNNHKKNKKEAYTFQVFSNGKLVITGVKVEVSMDDVKNNRIEEKVVREMEKLIKKLLDKIEQTGSLTPCLF